MNRAIPGFEDAPTFEGDVESWLVVLLRPSLTMALSTVEPGNEFTVDGTRYRVAYRGDIVATFDRLVDDRGHLIGIQVWPVAAYTGRFLRELPTLPYLRVGEEGSYFELHFSGAAGEDRESTGEQGLLGQIYRSDSGEYAIAAELTAILSSDADRATVRAANARWVELTF